MKKIAFIFIIVALAILFVSCNNSRIKQEKVYIPESNSLIGVWNMQVLLDDENGETLPTYVVKVISPDSTFFLYNFDKQGNPNIWLYGTISVENNTTYTEKIKYACFPRLSGIDNEIKYEFIDANTMKLVWQEEDENGDVRIVPELWKRVKIQNPSTN